MSFVTLVDSNVIIDLADSHSARSDWAFAAIKEMRNTTVLAINPLIYAEVSVYCSSIRETEEVLPTKFFRRENLPYEAAFLAGKCFLQYRKRGGSKTSPLPDFYIGAHATVMKWNLLTRNAKNYRTYFPGLNVISPDMSGSVGKR